MLRLESSPSPRHESSDRFSDDEKINNKKTLQYFIIVLLLFVTILIGGVLAYVFREKLVSTLQREMSSSMRVYDSRKAVREAWDTTQSTVSTYESASMREKSRASNPARA